MESGTPRPGAEAPGEAHHTDAAHTDIVRSKLLRTVALALVLTFPFLKIRYATGDSKVTGEIVRQHGPSGWAAVILDNVLDYPVLFLVLFVLLSGSVSILSSASAVSRSVLGRPAATSAPSPVVAVLLTVTAPLLGFLWALALFGLWWALATALATAVFRLPGDTQRIRRATAARRGDPPPPGHPLLTTAGTVLLRVTALVLLPLAVLFVILDGRAWESVRLCDVEAVGEGTRPAVVVEIDRGAAGITTGWRVGTEDIVSGTGCVDHDDRIRPALWEREAHADTGSPHQG